MCVCHLFLNNLQYDFEATWENIEVVFEGVSGVNLLASKSIPREAGGAITTALKIEVRETEILNRIF